MLHGEGVIMRVLDKANLSFSLEEFNVGESAISKFDSNAPRIVLVTGPTGSRKTTTLYSVNEIKNEETKIITTEDQ